MRLEPRPPAAASYARPSIAGRRWRALAPGGIPVALFLVLGLVGPCLAPFSADQSVDTTAVGARPPGSRVVLDGSAWPDVATHRPLLLPLGTDGLGRDVLSRLLHGARSSLTIAGGAVLLATLLGVGFGILAGLGRWTGSAATTGTTALLAFPRLFLLVALAALLAPGKWTVTLTLAATGWMTLARVVDGELRSLLRRPFVEAARVSGVRPARLVVRHLVPHLATPIAVVATAMVGEAILAEAALSFLGLGIPPPEPSWGGMAAEATPDLLSAWWLAAFPGLALTVTALGFQLLGDGLRDALAVPGG
ncbi:MAG: ABC transporter permease [Thermoanaerobaculia bacterium]